MLLSSAALPAMVLTLALGAPSFAHAQSVTLAGDTDPLVVGDINAGTDVFIGYGAVGSMTIADGAQVVSLSGNLGADISGDGSVLVTGDGSSWHTLARLNVGGYGVGTLTIEDGAVVSSDDAIVGDGDILSTDDRGDVIVRSGGRWDIAGQLTIGSYGSGTMLIEGAATVTSNQGYIGAGEDSDGSVTVSGRGSSWVITAANINIGNYGTGSLTIADGGLVRAPAGIDLGVSSATASGSLAMLGTPGSLAVLETSGLSGGLGTASVSIDGGMLRATADNPNFFRNFGTRDIGLGANGLVIDTDGHVIGIAPRLVGSGALTKEGGGVLSLTGENAYSGGTIIAAGTLELGDGGTTGGITGDVTNNGTLAFNRSDDVTFAGAISGDGQVLHQGSGTTVLTGSNTYLGGTTIAHGALQLGVGGTVGTILGDVVNDGELVFNRADSLAFAGVISGSGAVHQIGAGTVILTGQNTYGGGTMIDAGTLQIGNGGIAGSIAGDIANNGALALDRSDLLVLGGTISGSGSLSQIGSGTTILSGANSYTGATTISSGTLRINGDQSAATGLTGVLAGGTLGGGGIVGGDVFVDDGGAIAPGNSPGTLTINGDLTLSSGSLLDFEFGRADQPGGSLNDLIDVKGDLTLDGAIAVSISAGGSFDVGVYRVFNYNGALIDKGLVIGTAPAGSDLTVQTSIAGQVNLVNGAGFTLNFWDGAAGPKNDSVIDGGAGVWQNSAGNDNWTDAGGAVNGAYADGSFAVFAGTGGAVRVDDSLGAVAVSGMQFAADGYTIAGDAVALTEPATVIRVGDGSAVGAGYAATIAFGLAGDTQIVKTDAGTLVLSGANTYTGGTRIEGGTVQIAADANLGAAAGSVMLNGATLATNADLSSGRGFEVSGSSVISTANGTTFTLTGTIIGAGDLTKTGLGSLVLTGNSAAFSGTAIVSSGTLAVDGRLGGSLATGAEGRLEGIGHVGSVTNAGTIAPGRGSFGTLTVDGDYTGVGGKLLVETALGGDTSRSDVLSVTGATAGTTTVSVVNRGGFGAATVNGIRIIDVAGASNGTFTLAGDYMFQGEQAVIAGAYGYRLVQNGVATPGDGDWYLRSSLLDPDVPDVPNVPLYQPGVPVYEAYAQTLLALNEIGTMRQRIGDRQFSATKGGIWGRMEGQLSRPDAAVSTSSSDVNVDSWKMELGADVVLGQRSDGATLILGVVGGYGEASGEVASLYGDGGIKTRGYSLGATLTWFGPQGFYVDGRSQFTRFDSTLKSATVGGLVKGNDGRGEAYSLEAGKQWRLGGRLSLTPQVQMVYSTVRFDRFVDPYGADVSSQLGDSLKIRWGVSLDRQDAGSKLYAVANLSYEWLDGTVADVSGTAVVRRSDRLWGELGLGASAILGSRITLYAEASGKTATRDFGDSYALKANAGLRMAF